jgi:hypothetical protein
MLGVSGNAIKIGEKRSTSQAGNSSNARSDTGKKAPAKKLLSPTLKRPSATSKTNNSPAVAVRGAANSPALNVREAALLALAREPDPTHSGTVVCRFNHYRKSFPVKNAVLQWKDIDEEYSFSFVYKGVYSRELELLQQPADGASAAAAATECKGKEKGASSPTTAVYVPHCASGEYFIGLVPGQQYMVRVEEGPEGVGAEGLRLRDGPIVAGQGPGPGPRREGSTAGNTCTLAGAAGGAAAGKGKMCPTVGNAAVQDITKELLNMKVSDLHSDLARQLREARDIEDVLFSH